MFKNDARNRARLLVLPAVASLLLAACGSSGDSGDESGEQLKVTFGNLVEAAPLFRTLHTTTDELLKDHPEIDVQWYDNDNDATKMLDNARSMIQRKPDVIINYPPVDASKGLGALFEQSGIPCIAIDFSTPGCTHLSLDLAAYGAEMATVIGETAEKRGWDSSNTTLLVGQNAAAGQSGNDAAHHFYSTIAPILGYKEMAADDIKPSMTRLDTNAVQFDGKSTLEPSFAAVQKLMTSIPKSHNIILYTLNDDSTSGALRAIEAAGRGQDDKLLMGGVGASEGALKALRDDPRWVGEVGVFIGHWGVYALAAAQQITDGVEPPEDPTGLPWVVLTSDNIDDWYAPDSVEPIKLPALVDTNSWLKDAPIMGELKLASE